MNIEIKNNPIMPTDFPKGSKVCFVGGGNECLCAGEDDQYLHLFLLSTGDYHGVLKVKANLESLQLISLR